MSSSAVSAIVRDRSTVMPSPAMMCGAGDGGGGAGDGAGDGECAAAAGAGAGLGAGVGGYFGLPPSEAGPVAPAGPSCLPFLRLRATTIPMMMMIMSSPSSKTTPTIATTIQTEKFDFSRPSAFACWLL